MNTDEAASTSAMGDLDIPALIRVLWRYKYLVMLITSVISLGAVAYALLATQVYRADIVVAEARDANMTGSMSLVGQLSGLASRAGINIGGAAMGERPETQAVLRSRRLVEAFIKRYEILPMIADRSGKQTTLWKGVQRMRKSVIAIREDARKGTTTVTVDWTDPEIAARWANDFIALANDMLRTRDIEESKRNIDYLNRQIAETDVVEVRRAMYSLIEEQTKTLMLANSRAEYAFTVVDPAVAPEMRLKPQRTLIVLFATAVGVLLGAAIALSHNAWRRRRQFSTSS